MVVRCNNSLVIVILVLVHGYPELAPQSGSVMKLKGLTGTM